MLDGGGTVHGSVRMVGEQAQKAAASRNLMWYFIFCQAAVGTDCYGLIIRSLRLAIGCYIFSETSTQWLLYDEAVAQR